MLLRRLRVSPDRTPVTGPAPTRPSSTRTIVRRTPSMPPSPARSHSSDRRLRLEDLEGRLSLGEAGPLAAAVAVQVGVFRPSELTPVDTPLSTAPSAVGDRTVRPALPAS